MQCNYYMDRSIRRSTSNLFQFYWTILTKICPSNLEKKFLVPLSSFSRDVYVKLHIKVFYQKCKYSLIFCLDWWFLTELCPLNLEKIRATKCSFILIRTLIRYLPVWLKAITTMVMGKCVKTLIHTKAKLANICLVFLK